LENCNLNDLSRLNEKTLNEEEAEADAGSDAGSDVGSDAEEEMINSNNNTNKKNKNINLNINSFNNNNDNANTIKVDYDNYIKYKINNSNNTKNNKLDNDFDFSEINSQLKAIKNEVGNFVKNENIKKSLRENTNSATGNFGSLFSASSFRDMKSLDKKNSKNNLLKDNLSRMDSDSKLSNITLSKYLN
jgi:hypothetical protein